MQYTAGRIQHQQHQQRAVHNSMALCLLLKSKLLLQLPLMLRQHPEHVPFAGM
jgi:hypothetical protein